MIIRKIITNTHDRVVYAPSQWSDDILGVYVTRILRRTKSKRILNVEYIPPTDGFRSDKEIYNDLPDSVLVFDIDVGKNSKKNINERRL